MRPVSRCLDTLDFAIGRPTSSKGHRVFEVLEKLPQFTRFSDLHLVICQTVINDGDSSFTTQRNCLFLRTVNLEIALLVNLPTTSL